MKYNSEKCTDGILKQEPTQGLVRAGHGVELMFILELFCFICNIRFKLLFKKTYFGILWPITVSTLEPSGSGKINQPTSDTNC